MTLHALRGVMRQKKGASGRQRCSVGDASSVRWCGGGTHFPLRVRGGDAWFTVYKGLAVMKISLTPWKFGHGARRHALHAAPRSARHGGHTQERRWVTMNQA